MARSVLEILIKTIKQGDGNTETVKQLVGIKSALLDSAAVAGTFVAAGVAVKKVLDETVGTMVAYADEVRRVQNATGASAEDASKLIQILDDEKVSYEQLEKAIQKSGKAYDFSIDGIARMSDEYRALGSAQEKAEFMQERFGKQWISFVPVMQKGGQAIRDAADAVDENLVLTQKAVDDARSYEVAVDNLSDSFQGLKVSIGTELLPVVTNFINGMQILDRTLELTAGKGLKGMIGTEGWAAAWKQAAEEQKIVTDAIVKNSGALDENTVSAADNAEAVKAISEAHKGVLNLIGQVANAEQNYQDTAKQLNDERIKIEGERAAAIAAGWPEASEKIKDFDAALAENGQKAEENAAKHHEAMGKIQYDLLITKLSVDGLTDAEFEVAQQAGLMFGVFDQASVSAAKSMDAVSEAVAEGKLQVQEMDRALRLMSKGYSIDVVLNILRTTVDSSPQQQKEAARYQGHGYAAGGIATGPQSGHLELLHGTEAVIPLQNGAVPVQLQGTGASATESPIYVSVNISSPITILDEQTAQNALAPFIVNGIRQAKARGQI